MSSPLALKVIIPHLRELAELEVPNLSDAADLVVLLCRAVKRVKSDKNEFEELSTKAAKLLYVVINDLREKDQRDLDDKSKSNFNAFAGVMEKILDLALKNSTRSDFIAFWSSDGKDIEGLRNELDAQLRAFGFKSFDDLRVGQKERVSQPGNKSENWPKGINELNVMKPQIPSVRMISDNEIRESKTGEVYPIAQGAARERTGGLRTRESREIKRSSRHDDDLHPMLPGPLA